MLTAQTQSTPPGFNEWDWAVIAGYLLLTTLIGARLAGKQSTIRDFFLGGRKLPWWAICGSIIATEISAVTFVAVPALSFAQGGNLTYLQFGIGAIIARLIIGFYFVPRYYEKSIHSPYDYMGQRLGPQVKTITTLLFFVGAILGQGARVFVTAFVLSWITSFSLTSSIWLIGLFSIGWTLLGGMTTVIWTDVIQFCVLVLGATIALIYAMGAVPGGVSEVVAIAQQADPSKFDLFNTSTDLSIGFTLWVGLLAMPFLNLAALGVDQVMAQRMFCCKNAKQARLAIICSSAGQLMALLMLLVGIALYAYFEHRPPSDAEVIALDTKATYVLPIFIVREIPVGIRALIVAAVFAAAISSLDSALAALSQTTVSAFKQHIRAAIRCLGLRLPWIKSDIGLSKVMVVFWGVVLCGMATACIVIERMYDSAIDLALGLTTYTYGALLGIFLLAFLPIRRTGAGLPWAVPMAMLAVFGLSVHVESTHIGWLDWDFNWADWLVGLGAATILAFGLLKLRGDPPSLVIVTAGVLVVALLHVFRVRTDPGGAAVFPSSYWGFPVGTLLTFVVGYGLGKPNRRSR